MKTVRIYLNSIDKVKSFVNDITRFDNYFDLVSGRYLIDAKSIMGIFSLDVYKRQGYQSFVYYHSCLSSSSSSALSPANMASIAERGMEVFSV